MLDELFEMFDRDGNRNTSQEPRKKGIRGFFSRLFGGGEDHDSRPAAERTDSARTRRGDHDDDDDDDDGYRGRQQPRSRRDRDSDGFDFGD